MPKIETEIELPKVIAAISLVHVPAVVESTICPHCGELNIDYHNGDESGKSIGSGIIPRTKCTQHKPTM